MLRRRSQAPPPRRPHPDAAIEASLQRIFTLQRAVARKEALLDQDQRDIGDLRNKVRRRTGSLSLGDWRRHIADLQGEMEDLEDEIRKIHDEVSERMAALSDTDLAFLGRHR